MLSLVPPSSTRLGVEQLEMKEMFFLLWSSRPAGGDGILRRRPWLLKKTRLPGLLTLSIEQERKQERNRTRTHNRTRNRRRNKCTKDLFPD